MEFLINHIEPELIIVAIVLYFLGMWLKQAEFLKDKYIPLVLGCMGILICACKVCSTLSIGSLKDIAVAVFFSITQGILAAGLSTYVNQFIKQMKKKE